MSINEELSNYYDSFITVDTKLKNISSYRPENISIEIDLSDYKRNITNNLKNTEDNKLLNGLPTITYRFKFTEEFMEALYNFSKIHQYDERKDFKEAWKLWTEDNQHIITEETNRITNLGYPKGSDVMDKMFKSARYYFRKKSNEKKEPRQRRQYISVNRQLLEAMDEHIEENIFNVDYQPKTGFIAFCKENERILKESINKIHEQGVNESKIIEEKIKKTYKNRYFMLTQIKK